MSPPGKGIAAGATALIAAPTLGALESGFPGFAKGAVAGTHTETKRFAWLIC